MLIFYLSLIETQKDQSKFTQLYKQYQYLMYHIAYQILYNEQDAEDMVHKAFLKIIDHLQEYEDVFSYKTKNRVCIIVRNLSINEYNRKKRYSTIQRLVKSIIRKRELNETIRLLD